jgi:hypothetical protein
MIHVGERQKPNLLWVQNETANDEKKGWCVLHVALRSTVTTFCSLLFEKVPFAGGSYPIFRVGSALSAPITSTNH